MREKIKASLGCTPKERLLNKNLFFKTHYYRHKASESQFERNREWNGSDECSVEISSQLLAFLRPIELYQCLCFDLPYSLS